MLGKLKFKVKFEFERTRFSVPERLQHADILSTFDDTIRLRLPPGTTRALCGAVCVGCNLPRSTQQTFWILTEPILQEMSMILPYGEQMSTYQFIHATVFERTAKSGELTRELRVEKPCPGRLYSYFHSATYKVFYALLIYIIHGSSTSKS